MLQDAAPWGELDVAEILVRSSNIGMVKLAEQLGPAPLHQLLARVGLGEGLPEPSSDLLREAHVATGQGILATPRDLAAAYAVLANDGVRVTSAGARERVRGCAIYSND